MMRERCYNRVERAERVENRANGEDFLTQRRKGAESAKSWPMVRLGDVCEVRAGATHHGIESENGKYPVYGSGGYICRATDFRCPANSVTIGRKGTLDNPMLIKEPFWNIDTCFGCTPKAMLDCRYLWRFCQNFDFYKLVPSLGRPSTNSEAIRNIQIPLPPLEVQKEIVERLEKELGEADKVAANFRKIAEMADAEFKAELYETFGELERREFLTQRRKGAESACPMVRLGDVCEVQRGVRVTRKDLNEDGKYNVYQNSMKPLGKYDIFNCEGNNPFMIMALAAGEVGYSCDPFWAADDCTYFKNLKNLNSRFLYYLLLFNQRELRRNIRQTTIPRLSNKFLESLQIPLPPIEVQKGIVAKLDAAKERCEKLKAAAERGLTAAQNLRNAILSEAFE